MDRWCASHYPDHAFSRLLLGVEGSGEEDGCSAVLHDGHWYLALNKSVTPCDHRRRPHGNNIRSFKSFCNRLSAVPAMKNAQAIIKKCLLIIYGIPPLYRSRSLWYRVGMTVAWKEQASGYLCVLNQDSQSGGTAHWVRHVSNCLRLCCPGYLETCSFHRKSTTPHSRH